ncbi:MAG: tyrosine-type recombinase/integrase [Acidimicrobiales bacterium]
MRGNLTERGDGKWRLRVYAGRDPHTGRQRVVTKTVGGSKRAAERELAKLITDVDAGRYKGTAAKLSTLVDRWIAHLEAIGRSPSTLREYRRLAARAILPALGSVRLDRLRPSDLDRVYGDWLRAGLSPNTVHHRHSLIAAALQQGVKWGWLHENPARRASPPPLRPPEAVVPQVEQVQRLLQAAETANEDLAAFLATAALTGARRGELCALRWPDVDLGRSELRIRQSLDWPRGAPDWTLKSTKTHQARSVSLDELGVAVLERQRRRCEERCRAAGTELSADVFVFGGSVDGTRPLRPDSVTQAVGRLCRSLGMPEIHLHSLRHWMVTTSLVGGSDVRTVAGRAGHRDASMTLRVYAHVLERADRETAAQLGRALGSRQADTGALPA